MLIQEWIFVYIPKSVSLIQFMKEKHGSQNDKKHAELTFAK